MAFDLKKCNTSNYKKIADYGIRVARPGYDASFCAQNQLVFNSNWPIIQITNVIDLNKDAETKSVWVSREGLEREWAEEEPAGMTYLDTRDSHRVSVGKNYVWVEVRESYGTDSGGRYWDKIEYKKLYHGLGYQPLFYMSEDISDISGYIVLTSVCLSVDVDYPYLDGATMFIGKMNDYGIASSSKFGKRVPGLRSDMFSKLVQAVKTEKTSNSPIITYDPVTGEDVESPEAGILIWSPLKEMDNYDYCLRPFEAMSFDGFDNPFGESDTGITTVLGGFGTDGPYYMSGDVRAVPYDEGSSASVFGDGVAFTNQGQATLGNRHSSLVIIRSPMVSPEYEEVVI